MILLLGGTSETAPIAAALAQAGYHVLVSTATSAPLALPNHDAIERRCGRLDIAGIAGLIRERGAQALVDATHPYAVAAHRNAMEAARRAGIAYLQWRRAATREEELEGVAYVRDHEEAAHAAFAFGRCVLLTTGSRNLAPYVREASRTGLRVVARVLPMAESLAACHRAGIPEAGIIAARGPFSVDDTRRAIRDADAGVLVTKDGGFEGGMPEKMEAARLEKCRVVVVQRPAVESTVTVDSIDSLLSILHSLTSFHTNGRRIS